MPNLPQRLRRQGLLSVRQVCSVLGLCRQRVHDLDEQLHPEVIVYLGRRYRWYRPEVIEAERIRRNIE